MQVDDNADPTRVETVDEARASETVQDCNNYRTNFKTTPYTLNYRLKALGYSLCNFVSGFRRAYLKWSGLSPWELITV